jgi:prepilin-type N-terminal cleavage/methylation domain-containing protein
MTQRRIHRSAFTLTELIVVIAIIAILAALGTWGVFAMIGNQQRRNTDTTVRLLDKMLQTRWAAVIAEANKEEPSPQVIALAGSDPQRAKVIWVKVRLVEAFPIRYAEIRPSPPGGPMTLVDSYIPANRRKPYFNKYQTELQKVPTATGGGPGESSACLLLALQNIQASGSSIDDQIKQSIRDTDNDGLPEFVDNWSPSLPLVFERFHLQAPNPATAGSRNAKFADPTDTEGKLLTASWYNSPVVGPPVTTLGRIFEAQFHVIGLPNAPPPNVPLAAHYVIPAIGAAGKDRGMGTADDILSYQLRGD